MVEITRADREAAWPFRPSQLIRSSYRAAWFSGVYDAQPAIQAFAAHRLHATIAALEQPTPELVAVALKAQNQTRWSAARNLKGDNVYQPTPQDAMKAALAAAAKHLKGEG